VSDTLVYILVRPIIQFVTTPEIAAQVKGAADLSTYHILNVQDVFGAFALRFKVSFFFGLLATTPIWVWQLLAFFLPALKPNERHWVVPTFIVAILLFFLGAIFCYFVILDPAFGWLLDQAKGIGNVLPFADSYVGSIILFELGFGLAFQLPLIVFYLTVFNIIPYKKLRKSWRVVYIVLMVISAVITPDASPITMILMFAALTILYEASLFMARIVISRRMARQKAEEAAA
ncbi:MAG: twin-arginine translocase subunit TatC, partial [Coriobacteriia bacterium]|nr:twin-arginine translocase subunit TatC [Coriobacteriia bacterium]